MENSPDQLVPVRQAPTRLAIVADIHHSADSLTKKGSAALPLLRDFVRFVADTKPDAVIDLGDRISDVDRETDLLLVREVQMRHDPGPAAFQ